MRGGGVCLDMSSTCVQGGLQRPLGGYQPNVIMEPHSPAPAWNMHKSVVPKAEPMEEDRNDSGINSGSDFHSSSPGSDNSQDYNPAFSTPSVAPASAAYYSTPVTSQCERQNFLPYHHHAGFNPLTPPGVEQMHSPKIEIKPGETDNNNTLTPHTSPVPQEMKTPSSVDSEKEPEDALKRLQMTFEKNAFLPAAALSPKTTSEHSGDDENKESWEENEEGVRTPAMNSHGKVKTFKCKQCDFVAITKMDFWEHSKAHIKSEKILTCPKCPFITEYKHHLEYHLRNHFGSKPFKCDKCSYSCVNKSMLNSHMKSHSNVYQYRCQDCSYATKYCHSLKLHLRKYRHTPAMVLNPDGTPNPLPIIDVYGTRRGPKQKLHRVDTSPTHTQTSQPTSVPQTEIPLLIQQFTPQQHKVQQTPQPQPPSIVEHNTQPTAAATVNPFATLMNLASQGQLQFAYPFFANPLSNPLLLAQQLAQQSAEQAERMSQHSVSPQLTDDKSDTTEENDPTFAGGALDLSKPEAPTKNRRKGKAFKLERPPVQYHHSDEEDMNEDAEIKEVKIAEQKTESAGDCTCRFCGIAFGDVILYTMHMGYHGYKDPFTCNMCGEQCNDKVAFFLHIARNPHV